LLNHTNQHTVGLAASLDKVKPQTVGTNRFIPPELLDSPDEDGACNLSLCILLYTIHRDN
jgi:hypothetical protein